MGLPVCRILIGLPAYSALTPAYRVLACRHYNRGNGGIIVHGPAGHQMLASGTANCWPMGLADSTRYRAFNVACRPYAAYGPASVFARLGRGLPYIGLAGSSGPPTREYSCRGTGPRGYAAASDVRPCSVPEASTPVAGGPCGLKIVNTLCTSLQSEIAYVATILVTSQQLAAGVRLRVCEACLALPSVSLSVRSTALVAAIAAVSGLLRRPA